ncbi:GntR family transcriptional regulator [Brevibacterium samyangense]|uniref:GntR family transcriptional regulator n=1 Tax=Brevibacterium samyangense TaxID=366888 RepID=A0ABP5EYB8_9MICO
MGTAETKRDIVTYGLRRKILAGELERGARLRQDEVAEWFSASITPVREALRLLEAEGLVTSEAHRGVRVAGVDMDRLKALYVTRTLTECFALERATTRISRHELRKAERLLEQLGEASAAGDAAARNAFNQQFHFFFYDHCGLPGLRADIEARWRAFPWDLTLDRTERLDEVHGEHQEIVEAVRAVDPPRAAAALKVHIGHGFRRLAEAAAGGPVTDPFDLDAD